MEDKNKRVLLHLSLIQGVGAVSILKILKKTFQDFYSKESKNPEISYFDLTVLYDLKSNDFVKKFGLPISIAQLVCKELADKNILQKELELIEKYKIDLLSFLDLDYPANLKEIYAPPTILYCKGEKLCNMKDRIAIVGARKANSYAKKVIYDIVPRLVSNGYTIVSGGAKGVDTMAHKAAVDGGGKTIVVLGSGLMVPYPESNKDFFRAVVKSNGTLISPFPMKMEPLKGNFPARNRVIAGLSQGCVVVQAAQKSGALITAQFALEEGRQVFAVPGDIYDPLSAGCNEIIKQGAKLILNVNDILEEFGKSDEQVITVPPKITEKSNLPKDSLQDSILSCLESPCSLDELSLKTGIDFSLLQDKLFQMQLDYKIRQSFTGFWEKI